MSVVAVFEEIPHQRKTLGLSWTWIRFFELIETRMLGNIVPRFAGPVHSCNGSGNGAGMFFFSFDHHLKIAQNGMKYPESKRKCNRFRTERQWRDRWRDGQADWKTGDIAER